MLVIPCELIENNGDILRDTVLKHASDWNLGAEFCAFVTNECSFRNTLVDRIVSGKPDEAIDLGYVDSSVNTSEYFHLFVIEGAEDARLPFAKIGMNVKWVPSVTPYRTIKVRILNGAHTSMIPHALLCGVETVDDCLKTDVVRTHLEGCLKEIVDALDIDRAETEAYAESVLERFSNPYIHHKCQAIALNSVSKFRVRVLPSILDYEGRFGKAPTHLLRAFGRLIAFYRHGTPNDAADVTEKLRTASVRDILSDEALWGADLSRFTSEVERHADPSER